MSPDELPLNQLRVITAEEILQRLDDERITWLIDHNWTDAEQWFQDEPEIVAGLDRDAQDEHDWRDQAGDIPWTLQEPWPAEVGVTAAVIALNAAGCPTLWSHSGFRTGPSEIGCSSDPERAKLVIAAALRAGCTAEMDTRGWLVLEGPRLENMIELAGQMLLWRADFEKLPAPPHTALLGADGLWAKDLHELRDILEGGIEGEI